jgi:murein DD-endopeptidase MepM/ murein hydrolase activator NlpD
VKFNNGEYRHAVVPAGGETVLQANLSAEQEEFQSGIAWGDWQAEVEEQIVALPIAKNTEARFSQVFNGSFSHQQPISRYAVDIPMDVGTVIHAAKAGTVMLVKDDYHMGGVSQFFLDKANQIAVLHDDGSIALYGHILLGTAMVEVGQPVTEGEALAKSGSSGYSTGPHLHFVIIKNDNGRNVSIPFKFLVNGKALVPERDQRLLNE